MNTKEMIDILYKEAEMQEQEQPANMVRWGGVLGGTMGAVSSIKNRMGSKYTNGMTAKEGKTFMKNNPNAKLNKVKFGERMGNFKKSLGKGGLGGWKGMAAKTALGAGAMALGGATLTGLDNYGKERMASEIIDDLYMEKVALFDLSDADKQKYLHTSKRAHDSVVNYHNNPTKENLMQALSDANIKTLQKMNLDRKSLPRRMLGRRINDSNIDMNYLFAHSNENVPVHSFDPESIEWNKSYFLKKKPGYITTHSKDTNKQASEIIDELYKEAQSDIKCERCGYEGKPNYNGTCPKCGLTLGKYEPEGPCGDNYRHTRENPINDFTVEELVEKAQQEEWSY